MDHIISDIGQCLCKGLRVPNTTNRHDSDAFDMYRLENHFLRWPTHLMYTYIGACGLFHIQGVLEAYGAKRLRIPETTPGAT